MKMKIFYVAILLLAMSNVSRAQDKGFTFLLGPSVNMYYGDTKHDFSYNSERIGWQFNGQFGYISTRGGTTMGNMLAIFGTAGSLKPEMLVNMQSSGAEIQGSINVEKKFNEFYTLEAGMVIARFLRLSGGLGRQHYTLFTGESGVIEYFSGTLGLAINLDVVNWVIDANVLAGKDMNQNALRISTGFMVKF
ncbi:MAG: hypothetical protein ACOYLO_17615 [Ferruginibacter sp.]